ncbi:periplasmic nitrate reductase, NapE protein [Kiloniella sp. b19]|uniref:periplasmic nitrate reductase, NapE protein n=1 Tax=Kiloniella sp. GXU_MW_B19 TaxID=3141326 RepID=UPI0031D42729
MSQYDFEMEEVRSKSSERTAVIFLALILFPLLAVIGIGGYGFLIWMSQIIFGPPTV